MTSRIFTLGAAVALLLSAPGCKSLFPDKDNLKDRLSHTGEKVPEMGPKEKDPKPSEPGASLEEFLATLRGAVAERNMSVIASLMTANFGYQLEPPLEGEGVFRYWDERGLWEELALVVNEPFEPIGGFHVAPPAFVHASGGYTGYRAGVRKINGRWKFVYFVNG
jgi:hypothetical protein